MEKMRIVTEETRQKMREAKLGKPSGFAGRAHTDEVKAKISAKLSNRTLSDETKSKMSASQKGRIVTVETRRRISETHKQRHANKAISKGHEHK